MHRLKLPSSHLIQKHLKKNLEENFHLTTLGKNLENFCSLAQPKNHKNLVTSLV